MNMAAESSGRQFELMTLDELETSIVDLIPELVEAAKKPALENPFKSRLSLSFWEKVKVGFLLILVPFRMLGVLLCFVGVYVVSSVFLIGYRRTDPVTPMSIWRRFGQRVVLRLGRLCAVFLGFHWLPLKGKIAPTSEAPVCVMAPHSSFVDALLLCDIGEKTFVSRVENMEVPFIGKGVQLLEPVHVTRDAKNSRQDVVKEIKRRAATGQWPPVAMFPEGTVTNGECLVTFKPGAFYPGLPIQPVLLKYKNKVDCTCWTWDGPPTWLLLVILCSQVTNYAEIQLLPVYNPSEEEKEDAFLYARNVRAYMAKYADLPVTDHSYEDCRLMLEAQKKGLPMEAGLVEYYKLSPMLGMNCETMIEYFHKFAAIDSSKDGVLDIDEFASYLNLPRSPEVETIFNIYDISKSGTINFREYLLGFWLISRPFNTKEMIAAAFQLFDEDCKGYLTYSDLSKVIKLVFVGIEDEHLRRIFSNMDRKGQNQVSIDDFELFCLSQPEYALLFMHFEKLRQLRLERDDAQPCEVESGTRILVEPAHA